MTIKQTRNFAGLFAAILAIFSVPLMAQDIVGSKHDLTTLAGATGITEVCVFCHTPHGADVSDTALPLWNRTLNDAGYTRYGSLGTPTYDSTDEVVGSVSLACLSCHDGTQAMDSVINAPGSGYDTGTAMGSLGKMPAGTDPVPMLSTDLSDDHPISIRYGAGGESLAVHPTDGTASTVTFADPDFNPIYKTTLNSLPIWWVEIDNDATRDKKDLPLYARGAGSAAEPFLECGTCHDPHNTTSKSTVAPKSVAFLRTDDNAGSKICVACHDK